MNINVAPEFVLAGEAIYTVSSQQGEHYTYKVYRAEPTKQYPGPAYFMRVLTGDVDTKFGDDVYRYVGRLVIGNLDPRQLPLGPTLQLTRNSKYQPGNKLVKVAKWSLRAIWQVAAGIYRLPPGYSIKHEGKCGRCGRQLTHPASLDTGIGPECAALLSIEWAERTDRQPELEEAK